MSDTHFAVDWSHGAGLCGAPTSQLTMWPAHVTCSDCHERVLDQDMPATMYVAPLLCRLWRAFRILSHRYEQQQKRGSHAQATPVA